MVRVEAYFPIGGYLIFPTLITNESLSQTLLTAEGSGLDVVPSLVVHKMARIVLYHTKRLVRYAREINPELSRNEIISAQKEVRDQIWEEQKLIRAKELIVHAQRPFPEHPRIRSSGLPYRGDTVRYIVRDYRLAPLEDETFGFVIDVTQSDPRVEFRSLTDMAKKLGALKRPRRFVEDSNRFDQEGIRSAVWEFEHYDSIMHTDIRPEDQRPFLGSFLGKPIVETSELLY